jgi:mannosyl-oligosaccharide alpha-1,3-glucosidase
MGVPLENREVHNIYGALMSQASFYGLVVRDAPDYNHRPFLLSRSFFAGSQKYISQYLTSMFRFGAIWTGDNHATEEHMLMSIPMLLQMSVSGLGFVGADIGGFFVSKNEKETEKERQLLLMKWHCLGVFYPFMRQHSHKETKRREPYLFKGQVFNAL